MADDSRSLYQNLKRLFSTGVIVRNKGGKELKVVDTDKLQSYMSNAVRTRYAKVHATSGYTTAGTQYGANMAYQSQRIMLFRDYDVMDNDPIINSALDIYADECTVKNEYGNILTVITDNTQIKDILENLYYDIINIEFCLYMWTRSLAKYGDFFLFLEISPEYGIINVMPLSVYDTVRIEGEKPENPNYVRFETLGANGYKQQFENYEMAHFRLLSDSNFLPYGKSMLEGARRSFRQLTLMEDAMLIHRIMRAPEKRVFKIDVGNIAPAEIDTYIQRLADQTKKVPFQDPQSGEYNLRYNMQNLLEDFYIPVRGSDSGTDISNLGGLDYSPIEDVEYIRNRMLAGLKIPKAFLGYDEALSGKTTLAAEDIRFSRTIERMQRIIVSELTKIGIVHLYAQGFKDEELTNFTLRLTNPSTVAEQEKINLWKEKVALTAQIQGTKMFSREWIYNNVFSIDEETRLKEEDLIIEDTKYMFRVQQIEQGAQDPAKFGFPQDDPNNVGGQPGAAGEEGALGGGGAAKALPPGEAGGGESMPQSVEDLPTAADLGLEEEKLTEDDEETRGRPKNSSTYGTDAHVLGRDPLGFKARHRALKLDGERSVTRKSPLALENILKGAPRKEKQTLAEQKEAAEVKGTFLDEDVVLPKEGIEEV